MPSSEHLTGSGETKSLEELKKLNDCLDRQLERYSGSPDNGSSSIPTPQIPIFRKLFTGLLLGALAIVLPFVVLIRTSLYIYSHYHWNGWLALGAGVGATVLLLMIYVAAVSFKFGKGMKMHRYVVRGIIVLVIAYCGYGLLYLSGMHVKEPAVQSYYRQLHPLLRITVATATLADTDLVITDIQRSPQDYREMGLGQKGQSLHYSQPTGYVHAVDIRTIGKAEWKNWLIQQSLSLLGYNTLRHIGTADHLHVSLPLNDS